MRRMLALTLLVACKHPPPADKPTPAETIVPSASTLPAPPQTDDEVGILGAICDAVWAVDAKGAKHVTCDAHTPFTKKRAATDPIPTLPDDLARLCRTDAIFHGSFTRPGATEALLSFSPCWETAGGFNAGSVNAVSVVLAEKVNGAWRAKTYIEGRSAENCKQAHRAENRDVLVCQDVFGAFSNGFINYISVFDFAQTQELGTVAWIFSTDVNCNYMDVLDHDLEHGSVEVNAKPVVIVDLNHDGNDDATVAVSRTRIMPSKSEVVQFKKGCAADPPRDPRILPGKPASTTLEIVSKGDSYALSPASQAIVDAWTTQTGDDLAGLRRSAPAAIWP